MNYPPDAPSYQRGGRPDPCLGTIPGVVHACCGHGARYSSYEEDVPHGPYVVVSPTGYPGQACHEVRDGVTLRDESALDWFAERGVGPDVATGRSPSRTANPPPFADA